MRKMKFWLGMAFWALLLSPAYAQLSSSGVESGLNTTTANAQKNPAISMTASGRYITAWQSQLGDGSANGIIAKVFNSAGTVVLADFVVNSTTSNDQRNPAVALLDNGNYVVAWQSLNQDGSGWGVYFTLRNVGTGVIVGESLLHFSTLGNQTTPQVAMRSTGDFYITWESEGEIFMKAFNSSGTAITGDVLVNNTPVNRQMNPDIAVDEGTGEVVVTWQSLGQDGSGYGIYARRFTGAGVAIGAEFGVNTTTAGHQLEPTVAMDGGGAFLISWASYGQDGDDYGIYARVYDYLGVATSPEVRVNSTTAGTQQHVDASPTSSGFYVLAWTSFDQDGDAGGIYTAVMKNPGIIVESETLVNTTTAENQMNPAVASNPLVMGDAQYIWQGGTHEALGTTEGDGYGIFSQAFDTDFPFPVTLLSFDAIRLDPANVQLDWITTQEVNNKGFEVEYSFDAVEFQTIGFVPGAGDSETLKDYRFEHINREGAYYRLRQIDLDGAFAYSSIKYVAAGEEMRELTVYPNPSKGDVTLDLNGYSEGVTAILWSQEGKRVWMQDGPLQSVNLDLNQQLSQLPAGAYQLILTTGQQEVYGKTIVKQ